MKYLFFINLILLLTMVGAMSWMLHNFGGAGTAFAISMVFGAMMISFIFWVERNVN
jgi:hypothetical protein